MISVLKTQVTNFRAFGWVQDPSNLRSLCKVVAVFDCNSATHKKLVSDTIPNLVEERDGKQELLQAMAKRPLKIKYSKLIGKGFNPRSTSRCNGIIQAAVKGQKRPFIGDWPADNFIRWAHAFGFIKYNYFDDTFEITQNGINLVEANENTEELSDNEKELLIDAVLAYPPAIRILTLLSETESTHLTKFEIGKQLGFAGEGGFTSLPQNLLIEELTRTEDASQRNTMKADWEGSSDKYARMISTWLCKLGLALQIPKNVTDKVGSNEYTETIAQAYTITASGLRGLNRSLGKSRHKHITKNVYYELFSPSGDDREYLRTRRSYILKFLSEKNKFVSTEEVKFYLEHVGLSTNISTICDDMKGFISIGLNISINDGKYKLSDEISDFIIPIQDKLSRSTLWVVKDEIRAKLSCLSHDYLSLIDLAYDGNQSRLFEMKVIELFIAECGFMGLHLGGSRKPDGVIYTSDLADNFGVIVDTKAYSGGYNLPISQADEMERYIRENQTRSELINPNKWWECFSKDLTRYFFMFVSGSFIGNYQSQLERINLNTGSCGTALPISKLLICADSICCGKITHRDLQDNMFKNNEYDKV